ncbi:MAG TPA: tetratricopeptide repeat protein [Armatimonadetes bacterium]|nr:tetratricopeptide repeat protein [Armatimonadota bacterium]
MALLLLLGFAAAWLLLLWVVSRAARESFTWREGQRGLAWWAGLAVVTFALRYVPVPKAVLRGAWAEIMGVGYGLCWLTAVGYSLRVAWRWRHQPCVALEREDVLRWAALGTGGSLLMGLLWEAPGLLLLGGTIFLGMLALTRANWDFWSSCWPGLYRRKKWELAEQGQSFSLPLRLYLFFEPWLCQALPRLRGEPLRWHQQRLLCLACLFLNCERPEATVEILERLLQRPLAHDHLQFLAQGYLAVAYFQTGRYEQAERLSRRAWAEGRERLHSLASHRALTFLQLLRGLALARLGQTAAAEAHLSALAQGVLSLRQQGFLLLGLALVSLRRGQLDEAEQRCRRAQQLINTAGPLPPLRWWRSFVQVVWGEIGMAQGDPKWAWDKFRRAHELCRGNAEASLGRGLALLALNEPAAAREAWRDAALYGGEGPFGQRARAHLKALEDLYPHLPPQNWRVEWL